MYSPLASPSLRSRLLTLCGLVALLAGTAACSDDEDVIVDPPDETTIVDVAEGDANLLTLVAALQAAGLDATLAGDGPFTVFAPDDDAFEALGEGVVDTLTADTELLTKVLEYHVVSGAAVTAGELTDGQEIETLSGDTLTVTVDADGVFVNGIAVVEPDVQADNGVVHVIGGVLTQHLDVVERARITPDLSTLVAAIRTADLADALGDEDATFTVFAPTNAAFDALPEGMLDDLLDDPDALADVLRYHVVSGTAAFAEDLTDGMTVMNMADGTLTLGVGEAVTVTGETADNTATVVVPDVDVSNGVVHVIDAVLLPPADDGGMDG